MLTKPKKHQSSSPPVVSGDPFPPGHTWVSVAGIRLFDVIPAVSGGYLSEGRRAGFPLQVVGNEEEPRYRSVGVDCGKPSLLKV